MAAYSSLVKEILPYVPFCPDSLIEQTIRAATIEFCERSKAYILDMDPFNTVSGVYEYDFDIPVATEVHQVLYMTYDGQDMDPISPRSLELNYPDWRDKTGNPHVYLQKSPSLFWIVPVPSGTKQVIASVALKPTRTSNNIDTTKQPIFLGESLGLQRYDRFKYYEFYKLYSDHLSQFWRPNEISLDKEREMKDQSGDEEDMEEEN